MVLKKRTPAQVKKLAKETGMSLSEVRAFDAIRIKQSKENEKMFKKWEASRKKKR